MYTDNFYCRVLTNLGTFVYANSREKYGLDEALSAVKSFIDRLLGIRHLSFEIFEMLQMNELTMKFLRNNPKFLFCIRVHMKINSNMPEMNILMRTRELR